MPLYDGETGEQPLRVFLCHQRDARVCAGWAGTHNMGHTLAVRMAAFRGDGEVAEALLDYSTDVPLFESGAAAAEHGLRDIGAPGSQAHRAITNLLRSMPRSESP